MANNESTKLHQVLSLLTLFCMRLMQKQLLRKNAEMKYRQLADRELQESARAACQSLPLQSFKKIKQN